MTRTSFTAQELFSMAYVSRQKKMYGIPDAFAHLNASERERALSEVCDSLVFASDMDVDFDGNYYLDPAYSDIIRFVCEPDMFLSIDVQCASNLSAEYVLWRRNKHILCAEVSNNRFRFFREEPEWILESCRGILQGTDSIEKTVIPRIALQKTKRLCMADAPDDAIRILRQNGASEKLAALIVDSLYDKATFVKVTLLCLHGEQPKNRSIAFLSGRNAVLSIGETIANLRTCSVFTGVTAEHAEDAIESMLHSFMNCE